MMVRCGACRNQFDVPGAGRFTCPVCGSVNSVRATPGTPASGNAASAPPPAAPVPRAPDPPSPRITCPVCDFTFIVGPVAEANCPNCGAVVATGETENGAS